MTQTSTTSTQIDPIAERRRALSKVYGLLIRLAEETHSLTVPSDTGSEQEENIVEPTLVQLELL